LKRRLCKLPVHADRIAGVSPIQPPIAPLPIAPLLRQSLLRH
jgi:hypothetical protein